MKLRKNADTLKQVTDLIEYAFLKNDDLTQNNTFMSRYLHSADYGIMNGDKLASYLMVTPFQSHIFEKCTNGWNRICGFISRISRARWNF